MESIIGTLVTVILQGGPEIVAILLLFIFMILFNRNRMLVDATRKDAGIDRVVDDYHNGNMTMVEALNSLKTIMFESRSHW